MVPASVTQGAGAETGCGRRLFANNARMRRKPSLQKQSSPTEVRRSSVHGLGLFALASMPPGTVVGTYEGRRYSPTQAARKDWDDGLTYLFGLSDGTVIDGSDGGNELRHLNHACAPNCEAVEYVEANGALGLRIETLRTIRAGEELTLDYALQVDPSSEDPHACACGSVECRGTMLERRTCRPPGWQAV